MKDDEVLATLDFYEQLAHRLAGDARNLYLEANALALQLRGSMNTIMRERAKQRWYRRWWKR